MDDATTVTFIIKRSDFAVMLSGDDCIQVYKSPYPYFTAERPVRRISMNVILGELNKAGIQHDTLHDVFQLAESIAESCEFFRQPGESRLRVLDLAASLFDHVAAECIVDVVSLGLTDTGGSGVDGSPDGSNQDA